MWAPGLSADFRFEVYILVAWEGSEGLVEV